MTNNWRIGDLVSWKSDDGTSCVGHISDLYEITCFGQSTTRWMARLVNYSSLWWGIAWREVSELTPLGLRANSHE